ncbi:MAG TPA: DNA gyrase inhibitor YacG [Caulobacteraceae bacterium]
MTTPRCPICGKPMDSAYRPFCSRRCADVDLQRWLTGRYAIDGDAEEEEQEPGGQGGEED